MVLQYSGNTSVSQIQMRKFGNVQEIDKKRQK